ncbi:coniferyl aldehyde dehydrogenase [Shewanella intestini]|uniref:Aldehyde dehydrogenase n=1 Tax=Shewanella intestini TaxID=2017544 RepID=A0ABS5HXT1_9GAMM|nr:MULTISPECIES: coniferyl aldehyde dehydrogenase [Shewanella]MBR9726426.1 coniferyl aldehyde dehydrogenase [Shewanella intestini]MRG35008.1 aldehyde dehydrogenase family protein [Shewanella sp. XMDDZSB0408]
MNITTKTSQLAALPKILAAQKQAFVHQPFPRYQQRINKLGLLKQGLLEKHQQFIDALKQDYGHRADSDTTIADIMPCINNINYTMKHLKSWMKPSKRRAGLLLSPSKVSVQYQPLGVIGIIVPWNFPIMLAIGPLLTAIAAGNRAMLKMSEFTPATNQVITALISDIFSPKEVAVVEGEADVAAAFSALPFDHLLFTGSSVVGKHVMRAAADNLTPVTLELGGKSPAVIAPDIDINTAVERLIFGKCLNAGQICVSPDYVLCPEEKVEAFIHAYQSKFQSMYPDFEHNQDYGNIINDRQHQRIQALLDDASAKGAKITAANGQALKPKSRKLATQLVSGVTDEMHIMQTEIFGPLLPIISYQHIDEAISYIQNHDRPLALYLMSFNKSIQDKVLAQTHSGGVCINETVFHVAADDAPFGGIGPSGMGHYHGKEGFLTFSHGKTVLNSGKFNSGVMVHPPYGNRIQRALMSFFLR